MSGRYYTDKDLTARIEGAIRELERTDRLLVLFAFVAGCVMGAAAVLVLA